MYCGPDLCELFVADHDFSFSPDFFYQIDSSLKLFLVGEDVDKTLVLKLAHIDFSSSSSLRVSDHVLYLGLNKAHIILKLFDQ